MEKGNAETSVKEGEMNISNKNEHEKKPFIRLSWILVILFFSTYVLIFFVRNSFSVSLVAMINFNETTADPDYARDTCPALSNKTEESKEIDGEFYWTASDQGIILGAYFWGLLISRLLVSRVPEIAGQRRTAAVAMFLAGVLTLFAPFTAHIHPYALAADRFLIGVCYGPIPSAIQSLLSAWAPRSELTFMISIVYSGMTIGGTIGVAISGWLSDVYGWRSTFWIGGALHLIYLPFWIMTVRNSPHEHPWLTSYEMNLLKEKSDSKTQRKVPLLKILSSPYLHICIIAQFARTWLDAILATEGPAFFRYKLRLELRSASYVVAGNYICSVFFVICYGKISDYFINRKYFTTVNARRLCHFVANGGSVILLVAIALLDCHSIAVIVLWLLIGGFSSGTACSYSVSAIDLAPNYAGTFIGLYGIGSLGGAIAPMATSAFLTQENGWSKSFYTAAGWCLLTSLTYIPFISAEPQPWNFDEEEVKKNRNND